MTNYRIKIQYDGTRYHGWQRQKGDGTTIQGKIETALTRLTGSPVQIDGAGRTDAGVHARCQIANFRLNAEQESALIASAGQMESGEQGLEQVLVEKLNEYLPEDIRILKAEAAGDRFHSRLNATGKEYRYHLHKKGCYDVFTRKYSWQMEEELDVAEMKKAAALLTGTHDFKGFCSKSSKKKSTVRTIHEIVIEENETDIWLIFRGNGFLYNMVRILAGTLVEAGAGRRRIQSVRDALESGDRTCAGETAPAQGLTLWEVRYD